MPLAVGIPVASLITTTTATVTSPIATGGTGPYTYAFYRSTTSGFTPGGGNLIQAASASRVLADTGLSSGIRYFYVVRVVDSAGSPATVDSTQLGMDTLVVAPTISEVTATTAVVTAVAVTGGTAPRTYAFYRDTVSGFTPAVGNLIQAASASRVLNDSGLTPGTIYYYKVVALDNSSNEFDSLQASTTTLAPSLSQNQFNQTAYLGMVDQALNRNTIAVQIDAAQASPIVAGAALKFATTEGGVPKVLACDAADDEVVGFLNFNVKDKSRAAGQAASMSSQGNVIYLYAALAINRGEMVTSLPSGVAGGCNGGVIPAASSGNNIVGQALDTVEIGQLCRIYLICPLPFVD